ncbi:hypothetical protein ATANTOWER_019994 [Ataeniobius toweri]|uniref:Uncharacterized protein n=1 Tax=Ataeniobius toweri TaxID=208326 RepID=A0ABU7CIQ4_9TELE|nr:hypothetical protein [Ataeniobius toweri]
MNTKLITDVVQPMKEDLSVCLHTLHSMAEEIHMTRPITATGHVGVQTYPEDLLGEKHLRAAGHPRLQSTIREGKPNDLFETSGHLSFHGETRSMGKSPIKLQFPTFGKVDDSADPLQYMERCEDFLALNPLTDAYGYSS